MASREIRDERLVAVFEDEATARSAADAVRPHCADVRIGERRDVVGSLKGEMREEIVQTEAAPGRYPFTKEQGKAMVLLAAVGAVIGAALLAPVAFIEMGNVDFGWRLVIVLAVGALAGGAAGFVIGGSLGSRGPADPSAAHAGVTVSVPHGDQRVADILNGHKPIRMDVIAADATPLDTVTTEEQRTGGGTVQELASNLDADDFHRHEPGHRER
jgi:hypothetical protein